MDDTKLLAELAKPQYTEDIATGFNTAILAMLSSLVPGKTVRAEEVTPYAVRRLILPVIRTLTVNDLAQLTFLLDGPLHDEEHQAALNEWAAEHGAVFADAFVRPATVADVQCGGPVSLEDLWRVLPQIDHSHHARYLRDEFVDPAHVAENKESGAHVGRGPKFDYEEGKDARTMIVEARDEQ